MMRECAGVKIRAISACVPRASYGVADYCKAICSEKTARRLAEHTGFQRLRIAEPGVRSSDLCCEAATALFQSGVVAPESINALIFVTQTPDVRLPATAYHMQRLLGLPERTLAFDVNQGCAGYVYGLQIAAALVEGGGCDRALVCAGDTISKIANPQDRAVRAIFGDGGSATVVEKSGGGKEKVIFQFDSFGAQSGAITAPFPDEARGETGFLQLDGMEIMNFTLEKIPAHIRRLLDAAGRTLPEISLLAFHQANRLILQALAKRLGVAPERIPFDAAEIGNTSSASIPLLLTERFAGRQLQETVLCGFGVGLAVASAYLDLSETKIIGTVTL